MTAAIDAYLAGPAALRAAVAGMTPDQHRARPVAGKWSTLEVVAHLADFEPVFADRMKRVIALKRPLLVGADETRFAAHLAYHDRDPDEELAVIDSTRRALARILCTLPAEAFDRTGVHSERGIQTLAQILAAATTHIDHHLPFVAAKRSALAAGAAVPGEFRDA